MAKDNLAGRMVLRVYLSYTPDDLDEPQIRRPRAESGRSLACPYNEYEVDVVMHNAMPSAASEAYDAAMPMSFRSSRPGTWGWFGKQRSRGYRGFK